MEVVTIAWDDVQEAADDITHTEWNAMVTYIKSVISAADTTDVVAGNTNIGGVAMTSTAAELNLLDGCTATTGELNYVDVTTLGTVEDSKAWTCDASGYTFVDTDHYVQLQEAPGSDHTGSGMTINDTVGENVARGDILYLKSDGKWWQADADAEATTKGALAMVLDATINVNDAGNLLLYGFYRDDTWGWTIGQTLYVHTTAGSPTGTAPSGSGDIVRVIGHAVTADVLLFNPSQTWIEVA